MGDLVAIIGGSGIKDSPIFGGVGWKVFDTGYSNGFGNGVIDYQEKDNVIFIPRHGNPKEHGPYSRRYGPAKTQYGANLIAAKMLGAKCVIATSAVGSLNPRIKVGSLVIPNDFVDETGRDDNLFGQEVVVHANLRPAFSDELRGILYDGAPKSVEFFNGVHNNKIYVAIPGDRFGTRAEGMKRREYADIVGMTACPETAMALQLGLHYAILAFPVDYDSNANHERTIEVMKNLSRKVPDYIVGVIRKARAHKFSEKLPQLEGNVIPGDVNVIENRYLKQIARVLIRKYCS